MASALLRMSRRYAHPSGYDKRIEVLRERRSGLNKYAELLGGRLGNSLDMTVHEVFWTTERRRQALGAELDGTTGLILSRVSEWRAEAVSGAQSIRSKRIEAMSCSQHAVAQKELAWPMRAK